MAKGSQYISCNRPLASVPIAVEKHEEHRSGIVRARNPFAPWGEASSQHPSRMYVRSQRLREGRDDGQRRYGHRTGYLPADVQLECPASPHMGKARCEAQSQEPGYTLPTLVSTIYYNFVSFGKPGRIDSRAHGLKRAERVSAYWCEMFRANRPPGVA
jgi:hypothetical protein